MPTGDEIFPEIVTWASSRKEVFERLASANLLFGSARVVDWPAGGDVCAAYFAPCQSPHHQLQDAIAKIADICVHYQRCP